MAFTGKAKADQSIGPDVYCSRSPTRIRPAPVTKPSLIFQSALNIDGEAVGVISKARRQTMRSVAALK